MVGPDRIEPVVCEDPSNVRSDGELSILGQRGVVEGEESLGEPALSISGRTSSTQRRGGRRGTRSVPASGHHSLPTASINEMIVAMQRGPEHRLGWDALYFLRALRASVLKKRRC